MRSAVDAGADWVWIFDDDAFPKPSALQRSLRLCEEVRDPNLGMVWLPFSDFGGWQWRGKKLPVSVAKMSQSGSRPYAIDQVDLNMTLISRRLIEKVGYPAPEFFIMLWSCDYCLRVAEAGFSIWVAPEVLVHHDHAGSDGTGIWRSYYQTRNQLAMALRRRSPSLFLEWVFRQIRFVSGSILFHDRKWARLILRVRGAWHGFRGVMGKQIDPADYV
jgi:GT2 family glycosyltransferase